MSYVVNISRATGIQKIYFNATVVPDAITDLWAASWFPTDSTAVSTPYAAESLGNVNVYTYVKPMIHINDCIGDGGYQYSTAAQFIAGTNCGVPNVRIDAIVNKLKDLPSGKRSYRTMRYDNGPIYEEVGDRYVSGRQSPWAENAGITVNSDIITLFTRLGNSGGIPDYIIIDCEQVGTFAFPYGSSVNWTNQIFGITSDAKFNQTWYGSTSFNNLYTQGGSYAFGFTNLVNGTYHPQNTREYLFWDRATQAIHSAFINQFIVTPLRSIYPSAKMSNYGSMVILDGGTAGNAYNINGHPIVRTGIVGDYAAPEIYAGWTGASAVYGVLSSDTTKIVRTDYAGTTAFGSNAWNHFLIMIQNTRAARRGSSDAAITPWVASPYFVDNTAGFDAKWTESSTNLGLYYESIRHLALTGVKMFNYFNAGEEDATKLNAGCTALNGVLTELNTLLGGSRSTSETHNERVDFLADYVISGAQSTSGNYLWRVTPKSGIEIQDSNSFVVSLDADGGAWFQTLTNTKPTFTRSLGQQLLDRRSKDFVRRFYQMTGLAGTNTFEYDGWNYGTIVTFRGDPEGFTVASGFGAKGHTFRAYPFEFNPANPATSSPWHNIIYEIFSESYFAGMRALHINFPFGEAFTNHTWLLHPLDQLYGTTGFSSIYTRAGLCGMSSYNSSTLHEWCPARVKGFTGAINQLLEGTMIPGATGRAGLTEYCDVMIYGSGCNGWQSYRNFMHDWWTYSAGTNAERDSALLSRLDQMVNFIASCKASTDTKGFLSFAIDSDALSATPTTVQLFRSLFDYKSDVCELADWYFRTELAKRGIPCLVEARPQVRMKQAMTTGLGVAYGNVTTPFPLGYTLGAIGTTASTGFCGSHSYWTSDENYLWYSDPSIASSLGDNGFDNSIANSTNAWTHRLGGSYLTTGERLPWGMTTIATHAGATLDLFLSGQASFNDQYSNVYGSHYAMSYYYAGADIAMDWFYRGGLTYGTDTWKARRKFNAFSTLSFDPYMIAGFYLINQGNVPQWTYRWWQATANPYSVVMPIFYPKGFTTAAASKGANGINTVSYTGGYWTDNTLGSDTRSWFITNMRGTTFGNQLTIFKDIAKTLTPKGCTFAPPWIGSGPIPTAITFASSGDNYWNNTIDSILR